MSDAVNEHRGAIHITARAFVTTILIIFALMIASGILTYLVPAGHYAHTAAGGVDKVIPGTFAYGARPDYSPWRWLTAPVEVLWSPGDVQVITIIVLLVLIGGSVHGDDCAVPGGPAPLFRAVAACHLLRHDVRAGVRVC